MVHQGRLEINLLQLFGHPENSEGFSIISVIIFEVNIIDEPSKRWNGSVEPQGFDQTQVKNHCYRASTNNLRLRAIQFIFTFANKHNW